MREITKLLIVPVTKVPDNGGGVVWNTYDALDEIDRMSGNQKSVSKYQFFDRKTKTIKRFV